MKRSPRPLIGVNTDIIPASKTSGSQLRLHAGYAELLNHCEAIPVLIPPVVKEPELARILDQLDGVILSGSPLDLDPKRLGVPVHPSVQVMPSKREDFDRMLCKMVLQRKMPVLAVAVGMHIMNVLNGGSLFQHIPEDLPKAIQHKDTTGAPHRHMVNLEPGTKLDRIYGGGELRVNSYHHQAINQIAPGFRAGALAPDGVIEAIEAVDPDWFCIGVQWHPHSETATALDLQLFYALVEATTKKGANKDVLPMRAAG